MKAKYIIFDLDDTLMYEIDYLKSAYKEIAEFLDRDKQTLLFDIMLVKYQQNENVFDYLVDNYSNVSKKQLLEMYRSHIPKIVLNEGANDLLKQIKRMGYKIGLITDGRSITQRNKLKSLKIEDFFDKIVISEEFGSEKPNENNFMAFKEEAISDYYYIGDNPKKDFITPNKLGWTSICLLNKGKNIHLQNFDLNQEYQPKHKVKTLKEVLVIL